MAQLTVRKISPETVRALKIRAARGGRSAEAEHRLILEQTLGTSGADFWELADALRKKYGKQRSDSAVLLRQMRDER